MPRELTDDMLQHMIRQGYIVVANDVECPNKETGEQLYDFGTVPPESDPECREWYFQLYREAQNWVLVDGKVYRKEHSRPRPRKHRRRR